MNAKHLTLAAALIAAVGCSQYDDRPAEWGYISPAIFQPNCATTSCHSPAAAVDGLDFSTPENGYISLTGLGVYRPDGSVPLPGSFCQNVDSGTPLCFDPRPLVIPYDPAGSLLVDTLRARSAPRMPPDRPLPEADIELVERWILNGATEFPGSPKVKLTDAGTAPTDATHPAATDASAPPADARQDTSDARGRG